MTKADLLVARFDRSVPPPKEHWQRLAIRYRRAGVSFKTEAEFASYNLTRNDGTWSAWSTCLHLQAQRRVPRSLYHAWQHWFRRWTHFGSEYASWRQTRTLPGDLEEPIGGARRNRRKSKAARAARKKLRARR